MSGPYVRIAGWGKYLPQRVLTNSELEAMVDTSDEWIRSRSGIGERRIAAPGETASSMASEAALAALRVAGVQPEELDLIIVATATPDHVAMPSTASLLQHALGASRAGAFDLTAACSGFVYALVTGAQFVQTGLYRTVLVAAAEVYSRILDWQDRATCVLFGDAAGAVVLQATDRPGGLLASLLGSDGSGACQLYVPAGGSALPTSHQTVEQRQHFIRMKGREVFRFATTTVPEAVLRVLDAAHLAPEEVDLLIPHQANIRIIDAVTRRLGLREEAVFTNVDRYGNTSAASIPVALCEALEQGRLHPGANLVMVAFGGGLSWAAAAWKWH
ncbi:MAG: ketoacyl-ACP synthase III [Chloroflexi bacterium]|nr:ketoacyl-ACP synthase III [Chloroflexota bacterium]